MVVDTFAGGQKQVRDISIPALTADQVRRVRLRAAERVPKNELAEMLAMIGIGKSVEVRLDLTAA